MNKSLDLRVYRNLTYRPPFQNDHLRKKRVLQTRILRLCPKDTDSYQKMGKSLFDAGEFKKCVFQLRKAIILKPFQACQIKITLANAYRKLGKDDQCLFVMQKALHLSPRDPELHKFSIKTLQELSISKDINSFYQEIANTMKIPNRVSILFFESAEALVSCDKYPQAFHNYQRAIETSTKQSSDYPPERLHSQYGLALVREGLFEEAIIQFEKILETDPNHRLSLTKRAYCHYCLGRVQKAYEEFEYIIQNKLHVEAVGNTTTLLPFILTLHHLEKGEEVIKPYEESISISRLSQEEKYQLRSFYLREERRTKGFLEKDDIDLDKREFYTKKHQALLKVFLFLYK